MREETVVPLGRSYRVRLRVPTILRMRHLSTVCVAVFVGGVCTLAASNAVPARPLAPPQSFVDVAVNGLVWRGHRFLEVGSFSAWLRRHGTTYPAWARRHATLSLGLWQHVACPPRCAAALAGRRRRSWNPHTRCTPILTTIPRLIGSRQSPLGGASEASGLLQPHLTGVSRRALNLPCLLRGARPTFAEIDGLQISADLGSPPDGDRVFNVTDPKRLDLPEPMRTIHLEISGTWRAAGVAPSTMIPPLGALVDVQGFFYWDPEHTDEQWHSFSGWELHPLAAWRR